MLCKAVEENKEKGSVSPERLAKPAGASPPLGRYLVSLTAGTERQECWLAQNDTDLGHADGVIGLSR